MPSKAVRTTPEQWRRVGAETQESRGHRVQAQRDCVDDAWRFIAVRRGDGIHECKVLGSYETAQEARARCEADEYEFHWPEPADARRIERAAFNLKTFEQLQLEAQAKEERRATRGLRRYQRKIDKRMEAWKK